MLDTHPDEELNESLFFHGTVLTCPTTAQRVSTGLTPPGMTAYNMHGEIRLTVTMESATSGSTAAPTSRPDDAGNKGETPEEEDIYQWVICLLIYICTYIFYQISFCFKHLKSLFFIDIFLEYECFFFILI